MKNKKKKIEELGDLITSEEWKGKYQSESGFKDIIINAINAGYNLAKDKFKKKKKKVKKDENKNIHTISLVGCSTGL